MARNSIPGSVFNITLRPNIINSGNFDPVIDRHGQWVVHYKARPCPTTTDTSHHDLKCTVCHGRGEIYELQRSISIFQEKVRHGAKDPRICEAGLIKPQWTPLTEVFAIALQRNEKFGGPAILEYDHFDSTSVKLKPNPAAFPCNDGYFPRTDQYVTMDYAVQWLDPFEAQFTSDGVAQIYRLNLPLPPSEAGSNDFLVHYFPEVIESIKTSAGVNKPLPDRVWMQSLYYETPLPAGTYTVSGLSYKPWRMVIQPLQARYANQMKWEMQAGDMQGVLPNYWQIGKGDVILCLAATDRQSEVLTRSEKDFDNTTYFCLFDGKDSLSEYIIDEHGDQWKRGVHYDLWDYNKIRWLSSSRPSRGIRYSIQFYQRLAYRVMDRGAEINTNENKRLPKNVWLRKFERLGAADFTTGLKNDDRPIGDDNWTRQFGGIN